MTYNCMVWLFHSIWIMKKEVGLIGKAFLHTYQIADVSRFLNGFGIVHIKRYVTHLD